MRKSEVYSWRMNPDFKAALEEAARSEGSTLADLLDRIVSGWLLQHEAPGSDEEVQRRLRDSAAAALGTIHGGQPARSTEVRKLVRARLAAQRRDT